jgi:hypothetical protein
MTTAMVAIDPPMGLVSGLHFGHRTPSGWGATGSCHVRRYDCLMTHRRRLRLSPAALLGLVAILAACGGTATATPEATDPAPTGSAVPATLEPSRPSLTPVPGSSADPAPSQAGVPTTTETEWGTIWDALPPSFPRLPGWTPVDPIEPPASGAFAVGAPAPEVAVTMQSALELANYSTLSMSGPFEDGSQVIESVGESDGCRVETRITPLSGTVHVSVRMAADCPFE